MDPKLALLFVLISVIIGLSNLDDRVVSRVRRQLRLRRWRPIALARRRS